MARLALLVCGILSLLTYVAADVLGGLRYEGYRFTSLGFLRPGPDVAFGSSPRAFGAPGAGGSFAFADPDARLGYAYLMNELDFYLSDDPRERPLRDAVFRAIARLTATSHRVEGAGARTVG